MKTEKEQLILSIIDLCDTMEASDLNEAVSEAFEDPQMTTFQMREWLTDGQLEKAREVFSEDTLDTIQNLMDGFINSIS